MSYLSKIMDKEIRLSVMSLIFMIIFTVFTTTLYFQKRSNLSNAKVYEDEYTDIAFEVADNHVFIGTTELSDDGYNQKDTYQINLNIRYRDKDNKKLSIKLNYDDINIEDYQDTIVYLKLLDKDDNVIIERNKLDIINETFTIFSNTIKYSTTNYQYKIYLDIYNKYDEINPKSGYEFASRISADLN